MCTKWSIEYAQIVTNMQQLLHLCIRDVNARACLVTWAVGSGQGPPDVGGHSWASRPGNVSKEVSSKGGGGLGGSVGLGGWVKSSGPPPPLINMLWVGGSKVKDPPFYLHCGLGCLVCGVPFWVASGLPPPPMFLRGGGSGWVPQSWVGGCLKGPGPPPS